MLTWSTRRRLDRLCDQFEEAWKQGRAPALEGYLQRATMDEQPLLLEWLLAVEFAYRGGTRASFEARFPQFRETIGRLLAGNQEATLLDAAGCDLLSIASSVRPSTRQEDESAGIPTHVGRYRVERLLGQGSFGRVYLAYDEQLDRSVAVKVPHAKLVRRAEDAEPYLAEARAVAQLDHPNIVPVYHVDTTSDFPLFVVSKFVEGTNLSERLKEERLGWRETAALVASVAEALHYAHRHGVVHRDVKPSNLLIDNQRQPHIVDFGLALREEDVGRGARYAGTPAYMSPEQARGEGHRVDGRSDIFSLGVVFYELLAGRRPFEADTQDELLWLILVHEPRPPRQTDERIPKELERICFKALGKRASERYSTAKDLADDLCHFLASETEPAATKPTDPGTIDPISEGGPAAGEQHPDSHPLRIVPKGLRAFDAHDADFFIELLPGPRDRSGLPDSLRGWKSRIEAADTAQTFAVGLIYGPSGCGKSSFVRAGLLPRLAERIVPVYIECAAGLTELRLLQALRQRFPMLEREATLQATIGAIRRGRGELGGGKVLIVLDQFEQWLHYREPDAQGTLIAALRQCDGARVQCIVLVRGDFWMATTRFMRELETPLLEGENSAAVDLFDLDHARRVLAAYGRAFHRLDEDKQLWSPDQHSFLRRAIEELSQDGKVICVRLSLFAEMIKSRPWTASSLRQVGGTAGIGVTFLEDTFCAATAPPEHKRHEKAARGVLKALLPAAGVDIRGSLRSREELLVASGYASDPEEFDRLLNVLDHGVRLVTPTESPASGHLEDDSQGASGQKFYQLTHDYLIPPLRAWLAQRQRSAWRGRAELRLEDRTAEWRSHPSSRYLPAWWELLNIRLFTRSARWTDDQREMLRAAAWHHASRCAIWMLLLAGLTSILYPRASDWLERRRVHALTAGLFSARGDAVPKVLDDLNPLRVQALLYLRDLFQDESLPFIERLHAAYALASLGEANVSFLVDGVRDATPDECANIVAALRHADGEAVETALLHNAQQAHTEWDWRHKARLAIVSLHVGFPQLAEEMLRPPPQLSLRLSSQPVPRRQLHRVVSLLEPRHRPPLDEPNTEQLRQQVERVLDPMQRAVFIDTLPDWHADLSNLLPWLDSPDDGFRSGLILALGSLPSDQWKDSDVESARQAMARLVRHDKSAAVHSASTWFLRQHGAAVPELPRATAPAGGYQWCVNTVGITMIEIPSGGFRHNVEDAYSAGELLVADRLVVFSQPFLLSDREVSLAVFQQYVDDPRYPEQSMPVDWRPPRASNITDSHPVDTVSWNDAVQFCNWLSLREGMTLAYQSVDGQWQLDPQADGYRLALEAEWEYACRAGTLTTFHCGEDATLLGQYAVMRADERAACGSKLPNPWGLFDMHGNLWEWCQDGERLRSDLRAIRGGAFLYPPLFMRSPNRGLNSLDHRGDKGIRLARSISVTRR